MMYEKLTKSDLVARLLLPTREFGGPVDCRVVSHKLVKEACWTDDPKHVMWTVVEASAHDGPYEYDGDVFMPGAVYRFIRVHALRKKERGVWVQSHWSLWEKEHPRFYSCPLRYLEMTKDACPQWRHKVRTWHEAEADRALWKADDVIVAPHPPGAKGGANWNPVRYRLVRQSPVPEGGWQMESEHGGLFVLSPRMMKRYVREPFALTLNE